MPVQDCVMVTASPLAAKVSVTRLSFVEVGTGLAAAVDVDRASVLVVGVRRDERRVLPEPHR